MIVWTYHPGADDLLAPAECGKDSAKAIPGAELMIIDGMGQDMPHGSGAWSKIFDAIVSFMKKVDS